MPEGNPKLDGKGWSLLLLLPDGSVLLATRQKAIFNAALCSIVYLCFREQACYSAQFHVVPLERSTDRTHMSAQCERAFCFIGSRQMNGPHIEQLRPAASSLLLLLTSSVDDTNRQASRQTDRQTGGRTDERHDSLQLGHARVTPGQILNICWRIMRKYRSPCVRFHFPALHIETEGRRHTEDHTHIATSKIFHQRVNKLGCDVKVSYKLAILTYKVRSMPTPDTFTQCWNF